MLVHHGVKINLNELNDNETNNKLINNNVKYVYTIFSYKIASTTKNIQHKITYHVSLFFQIPLSSFINPMMNKMFLCKRFLFFNDDYNVSLFEIL